MTRVDQQVTSRGTKWHSQSSWPQSDSLLCPQDSDYMSWGLCQPKELGFEAFNHIKMLSLQQLLSGWQRKWESILFICFIYLRLFVCVQWNCQFWEKLWGKQNLLIQMEGWTPACQRGCGSKNTRKKQEGAQGAGGRGGRGGMSKEDKLESGVKIEWRGLGCSNKGTRWDLHLTCSQKGGTLVSHDWGKEIPLSATLEIGSGKKSSFLHSF